MEDDFDAALGSWPNGAAGAADPHQRSLLQRARDASGAAHVWLKKNWRIGISSKAPPTEGAARQAQAQAQQAAAAGGGGPPAKGG